MSAQIHKVILRQSEVKFLQGIVGKGVERARVITRSRVLLLANENGLAKVDREISEVLGLSRNVPYQIRIRYRQGGIKRAIYDAPRSGQPRKITFKDEAMITAIACTDPLDGYERWTLDLIKETVEKELEKTIGRTTIHKILLKSNLKPWKKKDVVYSQT